jgi:RNA-binding protein
MELTGKQKRHLRGLGHGLSPVVSVGKEGQTEAVLRHARIQLENHELIKVKVGDGCLEPAADIGAWLAGELGASVAQVIGHTVLLYKRRRKDPVIVLPKADKVTKAAESAVEE